MLHKSVKDSISDLFVFHLGENGGCAFGGRDWAPLAGEVLIYKELCVYEKNRDLFRLKPLIIDLRHK